MTIKNQSNTKPGRMGGQPLAIIAVVLVIIVTGWALVTVSSTLPAPSDFVTLPDTPLSKSGVAVTFTKISSVIVNGISGGVSGYLVTSSGDPVSGASVYMTYYFQGSYRTEVATTDQNGYFTEHFPMNWTGSLPLALVYFGDGQHKGTKQVADVPGENLILNLILQ
jgi:hypothetical protein